MIGSFPRIVAAAVVMALAGCASMAADGGPAARQAEALERYSSIAGAPVRDFHFWKMDRWEVLGDLELAVWTTSRDAYLLQLQRPCTGLEFATTIGLTSTMQRVSSRFDSVLFENQRCRILEIRPVDGKAYKAVRRSDLAADKAAGNG